MTPRTHSGRILGKLVSGYIAGRTDAKPRTIENFRRAEKYLIEFFGADKPIREITQGDAKDYWRWLLAKGFALNHVRRLCGRAKQFIAYAIDKEWLSKNPFRVLKTRLKKNPKNDHDVSRENRGEGYRSVPGRRVAADLRAMPLWWSALSLGNRRAPLDRH